MIPELQIYLLTSTVFVVATVGFLWWTYRQQSHLRRWSYLMVVGALAMQFAYVLMWLEVLTVESAAGEPVPQARFVGYAVWWGITIHIISEASGASWRLRIVTVVFSYGTFLSVLAGWHLTEPASYVTSVLVLVCLGTVIGLLYVYHAHAARSVTGERRLLFGKVRNLTVLVWLIFTTLGLLSRQNPGLIDVFTGPMIGSYLDVIHVVGVGIILLRSTDALDDMAAVRSEASEETSSEEATSPAS